MKQINLKIKYLDNFLLGILAGLAIGVGGLVNLILLSFGFKILGGVCFSIGLLTVCFLGLHLFTGKIGYAFDNKSLLGLPLLLMYIGNIIGAVGFGYIIYYSGLSKLDVFASTFSKVATNKIVYFSMDKMNPLSMTFRATLCGVFVYLAVDLFKKFKKTIFKVLAIVSCVAIFVICGMEHCIADMFYFAAANIYENNFLGALYAIIFATVGNSIGALIANILMKTFYPNK